ncbi:hypothetical protein A3SI_18026 [Nitritalea halalkaliphila LW7]|uniref:Uncharacterized protein n=1 Tax=Nitritalea halalkaliphila LW7 TaxID=1189621 RepID=I5BV16_9BACT|nr:hypothetical protein [Nitritalea halalkaliphila]EIM73418.1 hypothetical protein A3SI_18026 [Nitritalea halalkaliphila LW7]
MKSTNEGFDPTFIQNFQASCAATGKNFRLVEEEDNTEEYVRFQFVGKYEGKDVLYDAALYTLRLHHASEVIELAEHEAAKKFKNFSSIRYEEDEDGNLKPLSPEEEEIGWFITEMIHQIEDEETVKVQEFIDLDTNHDFGIGLDAALNRDFISEKEVAHFVQSFNEDTLQLDDTFLFFSDRRR